MSTRPSPAPTPGSAPKRRAGRLGGVAVLSVVAASAVAAGGVQLDARRPPPTTKAIDGHDHGRPPRCRASRTGPRARWRSRRRGRACSTRCSTCGRRRSRRSGRAVSITTASTGSGTGISSAAAGTVNIGASDAYLSPAQVQQYPTLENIPLAISGQQVNYNVPGVTAHLKLDGPTIAADLPGQDHQVERRQDRGAEPGRDVARHPHHHGAPLRQLG